MAYNDFLPGQTGFSNQLPENHYRALLILADGKTLAAPGFSRTVQALRDCSAAVFIYDTISFSDALGQAEPPELTERAYDCLNCMPAGQPEDFCGLLRQFCFSHSIQPETLLLISDNARILQAASYCGIASVGCQHDGCAALPVSYLFQSFDADGLPAYFYQAYCRYHRRPMEIGRTPRLLLRETAEKDLDALALLYQEAGPYQAQLQFFPAGFASLTAEEKTVFFQAYRQTMYGLYGFGMYSVIHRPTGRLIGHCGFGFSEELPALGYLIARDCRGQGYGLEACRACLDYLARQEAYPAVLCRIDAGNLASQNLAEKLGFKRLTSEARSSSVFTFQLSLTPCHSSGES